MAEDAAIHIKNEKGWYKYSSAAKKLDRICDAN